MTYRITQIQLSQRQPELNRNCPESETNRKVHEGCESQEGHWYGKGAWLAYTNLHTGGKLSAQSPYLQLSVELRLKVLQYLLNRSCS